MNPIARMFDLVFPGPRTHARRICGAMQFSFDHFQKMFALSTRPGWQRISSTEFFHMDSDKTIELDLTLQDLVEDVVATEAVQYVIGGRGKSQAQLLQLEIESVAAVREWFGEKMGGKDGSQG